MISISLYRKTELQGLLNPLRMFIAPVRLRNATNALYGLKRARCNLGRPATFTLKLFSSEKAVKGGGSCYPY